MTLGSLTITLDFELGWGVWENGRWAERQARGVYRDLRPALRRFTDGLAARELSLSWATVGAMVAPRQAGEFDHLPEAARARIATFVAQAEPATTDGRDLFDLVADCAAPQHIGLHSHSHTRFDFPGMTAAAVETEMRHCRAALSHAAGDRVERVAPGGIAMLVFPENIMRHWDAVARAGVTLARTPADRRSPRLPGSLGAAVDLARTPALSRSDAQYAGVAAWTGSMFFNWYGAGAALRRRAVVRRAHRALARAARDGGNLHLWLHPWNLSDTPGLAEELDGLLDAAAALRDAGRLEVVPFSPARWFPA